MALPTLLDIAKMNGSDPVVGLIDETTKAHPELRLGYARTIKGFQYKTLVRTALGNPTTGSFRAANQGTSPIKHTYENRTISTYILNPRFECDKAVADSHEDGREAYIAMENSGTLEGETAALARQFYYGNSTGGNGNALGFPGLIDAYDATNMVVDAGGTTASTGSGAWLVKWGPKDVGWVWGENGKLELGDIRTESIPDPVDSTKRFTGYVSDMLARPGLQVGSVQSLVRIKKLTEDSGKGMTDALIIRALAKFPSGQKPDVIFMSRRSLAQLQASRTATNATGAPAPIPTESQQIPIEVTDSIMDTESLTL